MRMGVRSALRERKPLSGLYRFRPYERLRSSGDFLRVKRFGRRVRTPHFGLNYAENGLLFHRLGMVVQKRFWHAAGRNLIKRRLREWFRLHKSVMPMPAKDWVIVARPGAERLSARDMAKELLPALAKREGLSA